MLNKALLGTPKEFKVTIGSQTHCTASTAKTAYMPGDLVTINISYNTGYYNATVATSTGTPVSKVNNNTYTFVMPSKDVVITASANVMSFTITVNKNAGGNVSVKSVANYGERVTVSMSPLEGYSVGSVSASGASLSGSGNTRTFIMPANNVTIKVTFNCIYHIRVTIDAAPFGTYGNKDRTAYLWGYCKAKGKGAISRVPYWGDKNKYLDAIGQYEESLPLGLLVRLYTRGGMETININGITLSRRLGTNHVNEYISPYSSSGVGESTMYQKRGQTINIKFDPPPTGYL